MALGDIAFLNFAFMIYGPPKVECFAVDLQENLVQMPIRMGVKVPNPFSSDLHSKKRAKTVLPELDRFVADVDPTIMQQIHHISKRIRITHIHHNRQANDFERRLKVAKGGAFCHDRRAVQRPACLNQFSLTTPNR